MQNQNAKIKNQKLISKSKIIFSSFIIILIFSFLFFVFNKNRKNDQTNVLDAFAQCLAEKKITMYGAAWCKHCQNEKKAFGSSFQYVPYVECPTNPQLCLEKGIQGYPTWIFPDGKKLEGEQGLTRLSEASACPLPPGT